MYNEGLSQSGSVIDLGVSHKLLEKKGSWIAYDGKMIGQGREAAKAYLRENPEVMDEIVKSIHEKVQVNVGDVLAKEQEEKFAGHARQIYDSCPRHTSWRGGSRSTSD